MTLEEKRIYHQIHPVQLTVDLLSGFTAVFLLWREYLLVGVATAFIPSTVLAMYIIAKVDLEKYKASPFGKYIRRTMSSKRDDWLRFLGLAIMLMGGWLKLLSIVAVGFAVVLFIWLKGALVRSTPAK